MSFFFHQRHVQYVRKFILLSVPLTKALVERTRVGPWVLHEAAHCSTEDGFHGDLYNDNNHILL